MEYYTIREIDDKLEKKVDKEVFNQVVTYGIASLVAIVGLIGGLYVLYYSGLSKLETSVAVLNTKVEILASNIAEIQEILSNAEITQ